MEAWMLRPRSPNETLDRMTRSAISRSFQVGRSRRAPRHRSASRSGGITAFGPPKTTETNKMKKVTLWTITLVAFLGLVGCTTTSAPTASPVTQQTPSPGPEHQKLQIWIGEGTYS